MGADQFADPNVDAMLQDARSTTDEAKRADLYAKIQQTIVDQAVELFLFTPLRGVPHRKEVQGYSYCPVMGSDPWWYKISLGAA
jgi:peptide/nickel transport system substrate-binding protein